MTLPGRLFSEEDLERNARLEQLLADVVCSGEAVAFVGAGSSATSGYPTMKQLILKLVEVAQSLDSGYSDEPEKDHLRLQRLRDVIVKAKWDNYWYGKILNVFEEELPLAEFHVDLVSLPFRGFVTTNYDLILERAIAKRRIVSGSPLGQPTPLPVHNADAKFARALRFLDTGDAGQLLHLHGCVGSPRSIILTPTEYNDAYGFDPWVSRKLPPVGQFPLVSVLHALLMTRRLVFVGYGLEDPYIETVLEVVADIEWSWGKETHIAILPIDPAAPELARAQAKRLSDKVGVATLFYEAPNHNHSGRDGIVKRLMTAVRERCTGPQEVRTRGTSTTPPSWLGPNNVRAMRGAGGNED